jgi:threonine dehydrogenase-like Zn-dependent dehydrogenase
MKALQIVQAGEMKVVSVEKPALKAGEVLVKLCYVGFCGSDLNTYLGKNPMVKLPVIPGHEIGAVIEAVGEGVPAHIQPGVSCTVNPYIAGPWGKVIPDAEITPRDFALVEPMSVGFHAVSRAQVTDLDVVMVIGCGMIGVGAIVRSALRGARVIAVDVDDSKLALAKRLGAAYTINSKTEDVHARLQAITNNAGPDVVIEAVGAPPTYQMAINEVAFTGRVVCIGYAKTEIAFETKYFVQKELDIRGSRNAMPEDFRAVIEYMKRGTCPKEELISGIYEPEQAQEAMKHWQSDPGKVFRIFVKF